VDCAAQSLRIDPTHPAGQGRRSAGLRVDELTGCDVVSSVPELFGEI
jgi:hypothetical protein